ncbi:MAG: hypothetical protein JWQ35_2761 [Bacteriovoracaceae bacterium]|nr:hypothetical protein [Bacteriovoracaceae bacterium]
MLRFILKEAGMLVAFVVLGGLLLLCIWLTHHMNESVLREFKDTQISVILKSEAENSFREWVEKAPDVIRFQILNPYENKGRLGEYYPELKNLISPLEQKFFPASALVTVAKPDAFLKALSQVNGIVETQVLHQPPTQLRQFLEFLTGIFSCLWLLTLTLVLYFHLERLAIVENQKWSLLKMLGSKTGSIFLPLWYGQVVRVGIASLFAILFAVIATRQIQNFFTWDWVKLPTSIWIGFFLASIGLTSAISFSLFYYRYKQVPLG